MCSSACLPARSRPTSTSALQQKNTPPAVANRSPARPTPRAARPPQSSPRPPLRLAPAAAAGAGLASGALWGAAAAASALAAQALGLGAAYPITQAGLLVAGLWGVLLFSEITYLLPQLLFWLSALLLVAGAALLAAPPGRGA